MSFSMLIAQSDASAGISTNSNADSNEGEFPETVVTESIQALGSLSFTVSIVLTVVLIAFAIAWLYQQRELLGTASTLLLALLRTVVIVVAVWMVAQPAWTRTETTSRRAAVVVLADGSGSMDTVDPAATPLNAQWQQAIIQPNSPLSIVDRAQLDLKMADRSEQMSPALLERAAQQIAKVRKMDQGLADACLASLKDAASASSELQQSVDRAERLALMASRSDAIQSALIDVETLRANLQSQYSAPEGTATQSRKQFVTDLLSRFEDRVKETPNATVSLRRAVFSEDVLPLTSDSWEDGLEAASNASSDSAGQRTNVSSALSFVKSMDPSTNLAAVLMLSEGQHNASSEQTPVEVAAGLMGTPVFTVAIGNRLRTRDVSIHRLNAPAMVYQEDRPVVEAVISGYECENDEVVVTLSESDQVIEKKTVRFPSKLSDVAVEFRVPRSRPGRKQYRLNVETLEGESSIQNNSSVFSVQTIKSKLFLLIADRQPRWEYRYLEQLFRRDDRVELDKFLLMPKFKTTLSPDPDASVDLNANASQLLPNTIEGWSKFDVVILGDLPPEVMTPKVCKAMQGWIRTGGNAIVVAGRHSMPAAYQSEPWFDLLPIKSTPMTVSNEMRPMPTLEGASHPSIQMEPSAAENHELWRRWMSGPVPGYISPFHSAKPTASVFASLLAEHDDESAFRSDTTAGLGKRSSDQRSGIEDRSSRPAWLSVHRVGSGQVAYLSSPVSYRLRIRAGDQYHHRFWGQLVRWMTTSGFGSGDGLAEIQSDRSKYDAGQRPGIRVRLADASGRPIRGGDVQIELSSFSGLNDDGFETQTLQLTESQQAQGDYEVTLDRLPPGAYQVRAVGPTIESLRKTDSASESEDSVEQESIATFSVDSVGDLEHLMTEADPVLLRQISDASGGLSISPAALEEVLHVVSLDPHVTETQQVTPLWNRWSNLWIILGCLTTDWWIRRRKGLV